MNDNSGFSRADKRRRLMRGVMKALDGHPIDECAEALIGTLAFMVATRSDGNQALAALGIKPITEDLTAMSLMYCRQMAAKKAATKDDAHGPQDGPQGGDDGLPAEHAGDDG